MEPRLIAAAESGSIDRLYALIHEYPSILEKIDAVPFIDTPTHVAAAFGNTTFVMELMNLKPSFARKLNPRGLSPLHLALEEGHTQLAVELTDVDPGLLRVKGKEAGMTPLLFVAKEGDVNVLANFFRACPECIRDVNVNGETALHIAVKNHNYEVLKILTGWLIRMPQKDAEEIVLEVMNRQDRQGNTVFHIAANENYHQALPILFRCGIVDKDIKNDGGLTIVNILKGQVQDMEYYIKKIDRTFWTIRLPTSDSLKSKVAKLDKGLITMKRYRANVSDGTRGAILVILALLITINFQIILSPPGGVYQANASKNDEGTHWSPEYNEGKVVMGLWYFLLLWFCNTTIFFVAISTTFIFLPIGKKYTRWFYWTSLMLYLSYMVSSLVITPGSLSVNAPLIISVTLVYGYSIGIWMMGSFN